MTAHLSKRQIERYLKKRMSPVELLDIDDHLSQCNDCHVRLYGPDAVLRAYTSIVSDLSVTPSSESSPAKSTAIKPPLRNRFFIYATAMFAVAFVLVWISFKYFETRNPSDQQEIAMREESERSSELSVEDDSLKSQDSSPNHSEIPTPPKNSDSSYDLIKPARKENTEPLDSNYKDVLAAARAGRLIIPPILQKLKGRAGELMSDSIQETLLAQIYPVAEVIESVQPIFRWEPLKGASGYVVTVFDPDYNEVATSESTDVTEWTVPHALKRGAIYSWTLSATRDGQIIRIPAPSQPEARFKILSRSEAEELQRARKEHSGDHLLLGALYARSGLLSEAELEFNNFLAAEPDSQSARKLLDRVRAIRRKTR